MKYILAIVSALCTAVAVIELTDNPTAGMFAGMAVVELIAAIDIIILQLK